VDPWGAIDLIHLNDTIWTGYEGYYFAFTRVW